jgi:hypothetical protein
LSGTSSTITWLHLSDAHFGDDRSEWDASPIRRALLRDLRDVQAQYGLAPGFVFFTGDVAFGTRPSSTLAQQYGKAAAFLEAVRTAFAPEVPRENVFVVPGNHDVERAAATPEQVAWLDGILEEEPDRGVALVSHMIREAGPQWRRFMERLGPYRDFLRAAGLDHLLEDEGRLVYAARRRASGIEVGIAGLNSAWSCHRDGEKGRLWLGAWQVAHLAERLDDVPISIALSHHPPSWLNEMEDPALAREIGRRFDFHLHGHEHDDWVTDSETHVRIAAGAVHDAGRRDLVYSFARVYPHDRRADIYLRRYDRRGGGWIPQVIHGKTSVDGVWRVGGPRMFYRRPATLPPGTTLGQVLASAPRPPAARPDDHDDDSDDPIDIFAYFSPASEIDELDRFIGRAAELERGLGALRSHGASVAIFGEAGVGKTSLAMQLTRIAAGNHQDLLQRAGLARFAPPGGFRHPVVYYACQQSDRDVTKVLLSLLDDHRPPFSLGALLDAPPVRERLARVGNGALGAQLERVTRGPRQPADVEPGAVFTLFSNLAHLLADAHGFPLVVVLDEFNVVADKKMFAGLLKEAHYVCFILVGTAADVRLLVQDHGSVPRQFLEGQIFLKRMNEKELALILSTEEKRSHGRFRYDGSAVAGIVQASRGMPYFTHFLGRYALDEAIKAQPAPASAPAAGRGRPSVVVSEAHVDAALGNRLTGLADLDAHYLGWVRPGERQAWQREFGLKLLACREEDDMIVSNVKPAAVEQGIKGLDGYLRRLMELGVLERTSSSTYRFRDIRFKVFARLRTPIFDDTWRRLKFLQAKLDSRDSGWTFPKLIAQPREKTGARAAVKD